MCFELYVFISTIEYFPNFHPRLVNALLVSGHMIGFTIFICFLADMFRKYLTFLFSFSILLCSGFMIIASFSFGSQRLEMTALVCSCKPVVCVLFYLNFF